VSDCTIDTDLEILIPDDYVESITERLSLYTRLDNCENENELNEFEKELADRFGPLPGEVKDLLTTVRCRWAAVDLGFEKMVLKDKALRCYFVNKNDSPYFDSATFTGILNYIKQATTKARMKQVGTNFFMIVNNVEDMNEMLSFLQRMHDTVITKETSLADA
jgi:transcription-repair coupling factor (superfamily II helicase)